MSGVARPAPPPIDKSMHIRRLIIDLSHQRRYWVALVLIGIALELAALYYQYVLDEWPCVLCIHVRIWIFAFILVGLAALILHRSLNAIRACHALTVLAMGGMLERSYQVLAIERGWVFGDCSMELGMPAWFAIDKWFPWIFEVQTSCGYTPFIIFKISMAEVLLVVSILLLISSLALFIASWKPAQD